MNALESALMQSYLDGELDAEASEAFEILVLQREDLAEIVEADTVLKIGLTDSLPPEVELMGAPYGSSGQVIASKSGASRPGGHAVDHMRSHGARDRHVEGRVPRRPPGRVARILSIAAAAVVLFGVGLGLGSLNGRNDSTPGFGMAVQIEKMRGIGRAQSVSLPDNVYLVAYVDATSALNCQSNPRVRFAQAESVLFDRPARIDELGFVWLVVPRSKLASGEARVEIFCGDVLLADYPVDLVK
jgi:hypothetical protein